MYSRRCRMSVKFFSTSCPSQDSVAMTTLSATPETAAGQTTNIARQNDSVATTLVRNLCRNLFIRTNTLTRKFSNCSKSVKIMLFQSFCLCFYGIALWKKYTSGCINRLKSAYHKCIKSFFGFSRMDSMTGVLMQLGLPSFDTVMWNYRKKLSSQRATCDNLLVKHLHSLSRCT